MGAVESVKAASDIYAPVAGKVVEVNDDVQNNPKLINESPENQGWLCKIKLSNPSEFNQLLDTKQYEAHCKQAAESQ